MRAEQMPIYAYRCSACGAEKDVLQKFSDAPLTACPACAAESFHRVLTAPAFQLKGSGWYVTDFRDGNKPKGASGKGDAAGGEGSAPAKAAEAGASKAGDAKSGDTKSGDAAGGGSASKAPESSTASAASGSGTA